MKTYAVIDCFDHSIIATYTDRQKAIEECMKNWPAIVYDESNVIIYANKDLPDDISFC